MSSSTIIAPTGPVTGPVTLDPNLPLKPQVARLRELQVATQRHLINERVQFVATQYCRHRRTMLEISHQMALPPPAGLGIKVSRQMIAKYFAKAEAQWRLDANRSMDEWKAAEVADLDHMETQAARHSVDDERTDQQQWFRSRLAIKERRAKMLGLDAEQRVRLEGNNMGGALTIALLDLILEQAGLDYDARDDRGIPITMLDGGDGGTGTSTTTIPTTISTTLATACPPAGQGSPDLAGDSHNHIVPSSSSPNSSPGSSPDPNFKGE